MEDSVEITITSFDNHEIYSELLDVEDIKRTWLSHDSDADQHIRDAIRNAMVCWCNRRRIFYWEDDT